MRLRLTKGEIERIQEEARRRQATDAADSVMPELAAQYLTGKQLRAARARLILRLLDRTPCACGASATICVAANPIRWECAGCNRAELDNWRAT